jgi:HTH-type transcriptional regulator, sugar sensing transcriptional regulator
MENLVDKLKELGFNTYEAKVYIALLKHHPATGYEISKDSGVPQARAYDTLKALEANKVVVAIGGKPTTYTPITPSELLDRWERSFKSSIGYLREALPSMSHEMVEPVINLRGEESIFQHAREMIDQAKQSLFLELWREDAEKLSNALRAASERGVDIKIVGYDNAQLDFCEVYQHGLARTIENSLGGRWLILSVDDQEGIVGTVPIGDRVPQAVYTRNPGIVLIIKELIVHDIFLLDVEENLQEQMEKVYGKNLMSLRKKILGDEAMVGAH